MSSTTGSNLGLKHTWALGESGWNTENDTNLKTLDALVQAQVLSATTTAQPGSPASGDRYILPASSTGASWAGNDGKVARYNGTAWEFYTPKAGWELRAADTKQPWRYSGSAWALVGSLYGQYADDTAAAAGSVPVGGFYVNSSSGALQVRLT